MVERKGLSEAAGGVLTPHAEGVQHVPQLLLPSMASAPSHEPWQEGNSRSGQHHGARDHRNAEQVTRSRHHFRQMILCRTVCPCTAGGVYLLRCATSSFHSRHNHHHCFLRPPRKTFPNMRVMFPRSQFDRDRARRNYLASNQSPAGA